MPGGRAALYTIKPTSGITSLRGIVPISDMADSAGPIAKSIEDLISVLEIITDSASTIILQGRYSTAIRKSESESRVSIVEPST